MAEGILRRCIQESLCSLFNIELICVNKYKLPKLVISVLGSSLSMQNNGTDTMKSPTRIRFSHINTITIQDIQRRLRVRHRLHWEVYQQ